MKAMSGTEFKVIADKMVGIIEKMGINGVKGPIENVVSRFENKDNDHDFTNVVLFHSANEEVFDRDNAKYDRKESRRIGKVIRTLESRLIIWPVENSGWYSAV